MQELSSIQEFPCPLPRPLPLPRPRGFWMEGFGHDADGLEEFSAAFLVLFLEPRGLPLPLFVGWS